MRNIVKSTTLTPGLKKLKFVSSLCTFIYYFTDNIVWLSKIGYIDKYVPGMQVKWGKIKDQFSLMKTILELIIFTYTRYLKKREFRKMKETLLSLPNNLITKKEVSYVYLRKLVILRREIRFLSIEIFIYSMRMILLIGNLKLVGHSYLDPVLVSICALSQAWASVFKSMKSKKNFFRLEIEDIENHNKEDTTGRKRFDSLDQIDMKKMYTKV